MCSARCAALQVSGHPASVFPTLNGCPSIVLILAVGGGGVAELLWGQMSLGRGGGGGGAARAAVDLLLLVGTLGFRSEDGGGGSLAEWSGGIGRPCGW